MINEKLLPILDAHMEAESYVNIVIASMSSIPAHKFLIFAFVEYIENMPH
jgi:hypothetical protein